ncbi:MAG: hypothetical protein J6T78_01575 [Bacteroidaceae bacterium]|nr:hypothetical protein [Bacteroidaceae bacterium]
MKKTYKTPELFAVELQHQDNVLVQTSFEYNGPGTGIADVKEFEFVDDEEDAGTTTGPRSIWDEEW